MKIKIERKKKMKIVCFCGPSGIGKTSYAKMLQDRNNFKRAKTITTRKPRIDDDCHFYVSKKNFCKMIENNLFLEWDIYKDNYYGTLKSELENCELSYDGIVLDLTVEGCINIKQKHKDAVIILLLPDNKLWIKKRLIEQQANTTEEINLRLEDFDNILRKIDNVQAIRIFCKENSETWGKTYDKIINVINRLH